MQDYDVTLKLLLQNSKVTIRELTGSTVEKWLDVQLPKVQNLRVDLLGEAPDGLLFQVELQSTNDMSMALRMAEYGLGVYRLLGRFPRQIVLYVGEAPLSMPNELADPPNVLFRHRAIDIRELDGERLLESGDIHDNVIAILARLRDHKDAVRRIVARISGMEPGEREGVASQLLILAGLRRLAKIVIQELERMPIHIDLMENEVIGPELRRKFQEGLQEGRQEGRQQGRQQGELAVMRRLIEKRFGVIPGWAEARLAARTASELEELAVRLLDTPSLEDLLK